MSEFRIIEGDWRWRRSWVSIGAATAPTGPRSSGSTASGTYAGADELIEITDAGREALR